MIINVFFRLDLDEIWNLDLGLVWLDLVWFGWVWINIEMPLSRYLACPARYAAR